MRGHDQLRLRRKRVGEFEIDRRAAASEIDQGGVGEADIDAAAERGDGRIGTTISPSSVITSCSGASGSRPWPSTGSSISLCPLPRLQRLNGMRT
jgi:hypothetical protein